MALAINSAGASAQRFSQVGDDPQPSVLAQNTNGVAEFAVTIRNDSRFRGALRVRLVLDDGPTVSLGGRRRVTIVGRQSIKVWLTTRAQLPLRIGASEVRRIRVQLNADPIPTTALKGVLAIPARGTSRISPLAVRVSTTPKPEDAPSPFEKAKVKPPSIVIKARRTVPSFIGGGGVRDNPQNVEVSGIAAATALLADSRAEPASGDSGGRASISFKRAAIKPTVDTTTVTVDVTSVDRQGTYKASIAVDEVAEKSPAVDVTVLAADHWIYPLGVLFVGALLAYWLVSLRETMRPKRVLQLALTRAAERHAANVTSVKAKDLPQPYSLDGLFPTGKWNCQATEKRKALQLFCDIDAAPRQEMLDAMAAQVADLEARVDGWPKACAKASSLKEATSKLPKGVLAKRLRQASAALIKLPDDEVPGDEAETKAYLESIDDQVTAVREWLHAEVLYRDAARLFDSLETGPQEHDPDRWLEDLKAAQSLADLTRCKVIPGLCRDVHVLRTLVNEDASPQRRALRRLEAQRGVEDPETESADKGIFEFPSIKRPPPALPAPALTQHLLAAIGSGDRTGFWVTAGITALAYMVGVYGDTFGTMIDYLTAFAAGAGATFAANWKLLPWYASYKPPKPT